MLSFFKPARWLLLGTALSAISLAQLLPAQPTLSPANQSAPDPLGRDTPSGTVYGFLQAAQAGNYSTAAQYLQLSNARRVTQGEDLATKLKVVMDRAFTGNLRSSLTHERRRPLHRMVLPNNQCRKQFVIPAQSPSD